MVSEWGKEITHKKIKYKYFPFSDLQYLQCLPKILVQVSNFLSTNCWKLNKHFYQDIAVWTEYKDLARNTERGAGVGGGVAYSGEGQRGKLPPHNS